MVGTQIYTVVGTDIVPKTSKAQCLEQARVDRFVADNAGAQFLFIASMGPLLRGYYRPRCSPPLDLWIGGEGAGIPRIEVGDPRGIEREQLFAFRNGDWIVLVDCEINIGTVSLRRGKFYLYEADEEDLVKHVLRRVPFMQVERELRWGIRVLRALRVQKRVARPLIEAIQQRFDPTFKVNWGHAHRL